jgi:adenine-specific DNA-methyltransferase
MSPSPAEGRSVPDYASTRLIAYIGNKRALLPFLKEAFLELDGEATVTSFLDPFAGSGAVSRLARSLGWKVAANDIEEYSRAVNAAWLGVDAEIYPGLFSEVGGPAAALAALNDLHPLRGDAEPPGLCVEPYIARHYAPAHTATADWRRERLFYTRENAVFLDRAREAIERLRPHAPVGSKAAMERDLLIGLLVYEAATHANTSGVFKAYHKGFGGHGGDALRRIMAPMELEEPILWPGAPAEVSRADATIFCAGRSADLCYLDPPYNQHQYGSNYHLLNTIARWEREPVSEERRESGSYVEVSGIPSGWAESRSAYCSRRGRVAAGAFRDLLAAIDARCVVLSYNTEGIVPAEELFDLLSDRALVSVRSAGYSVYKGGRQSADRKSRNAELLFIARRSSSRGAIAGPSKPSAGALRELELDLRLRRALAGTFDPELLAVRAAMDGDGALLFALPGTAIALASYRGLVLEDGAEKACAALDARDQGSARVGAGVRPRRG